jgi:glycosyltransferase involved in cell wall biosynthesis
MKRILFIVEKDFLSRHVGVARVILYYVRGLQAEGVQVDFAFPDGLALRLGTLVEKAEAGGRRHQLPPPWYASEGISAQNTRPVTGSTARYSISWTLQVANPHSYDANLVTAPWVCAAGLAPLPRLVGIVYDLVPNLAMAACLRLPFWDGLPEFAWQHELGFRYYLDNALRILCISQSTRTDLLQMYEIAPRMAERIVVDIPYVHDFMPSRLASPGVEGADTEGTEARRGVLLVNALDWRKSLDLIQRVLIRTAAMQPFDLTIVGQERIPMPEVEKAFAALEKAGIRIFWWRHADDEVLNACYQRAGVLLFPSLYEGLGLPVLEAQSAGLPVITSKNSSFPEINLNKGLCLDLYDVEGMTASMLQCINRDAVSVANGVELRAMMACRFMPPDSYTQRIIPNE